MIIRHRLQSSIFLALLACLPVTAGQNQTKNQTQNHNLDREFQAAVAQYDSGRFTEAVAQLENLLRDAPESFEVHELLGLAYSAQSQDAKANEHLEKAVRLKPDSAPARTTSGTPAALYLTDAS